MQRATGIQQIALLMGHLVCAIRFLKGQHVINAKMD